MDWLVAQEKFQRILVWNTIDSPPSAWIMLPPWSFYCSLDAVGLLFERLYQQQHDRYKNPSLFVYYAAGPCTCLQLLDAARCTPRPVIVAFSESRRDSHFYTALATLYPAYQGEDLALPNVTEVRYYVLVEAVIAYLCEAVRQHCCITCHQGQSKSSKLLNL